MNADNDSTPAVAVRDLCYAPERRKSTWLLDHVTFRIQSGEFVSVIGANGAGKTTLARCLIRFVDKTSGGIDLFGRDQTDYCQKELARLIGYVPQNTHYTGAFSVQDFCLLSRFPHTRRFAPVSQEDRDHVENALEITGTLSFATRQVATLSGGERQRVFLAAALAQQTKILLIDEPTAHLDYLHQHQVIDILMRMNREQHVTVIAITHDLHHAVLASHRVIALKSGQMTFNGAPSDLVKGGNLRAVYGVDFQVLRHEASGETTLVPRRQP